MPGTHGPVRVRLGEVKGIILHLWYKVYWNCAVLPLISPLRFGTRPRPPRTCGRQIGEPWGRWRIFWGKPESFGGKPEKKAGGGRKLEREI
eukprot:3156717-Rhodomonas_salina.1